MPGPRTSPSFRLLSLLVEEPWSGLATAVLLLMAVGLELALPALAGQFVNQVRGDVPLSNADRTARWYLTLSLAAGVIGVAARYWSRRLAWVATNRLRLDLARHLLRLDGRFYETRPPAELWERVDGDTAVLMRLLSESAIQVLGSVLLMGGALIAMVVTAGVLGLLLAVIVAGTILLLAMQGRRSAPLYVADRQAGAETYGVLGEALSAAEDLSTLGATRYAWERLTHAFTVWAPRFVAAELQGYRVWMTALIAFSIGDGIAYGISGHLYLLRHLSLGAVYAVIAYAGMLAAPLDTLRDQLQYWPEAWASVGRLRELLDEPVKLHSGSLILPPGPLALEFDGVTFSYEEGGHSKASASVHDVTFHLPSGHHLGVVGPTGSGKTLVGRLAARILDPDRGVVLVGGVDLRHINDRSRGRSIALITQTVHWFGASLRDNLTFFDPSIKDRDLVNALTRMDLMSWMTARGLGRDDTVPAEALSAGELQLLALTRAFLGDPGLVILEEPASRVDPETGARVVRAVRTLLEGRTAVIMTPSPAIPGDRRSRRGHGRGSTSGP